MKSILVHYNRNGWSKDQLKWRKIFMVPSMVLRGINCCVALLYAIALATAYFVYRSSAQRERRSDLYILFSWQQSRSLFTTKRQAKKCHNAIALLSVLIMLVLLQSCSSKSDEAQDKKETVVPAPAAATEVFAVQKGMLTTSLQIPGELIAFQQVDIYAKENSFVKKLYVDVGSEVKTGQLLAAMEAPELSSQLSAAGARLKSQEALYIASKANYERLLETSKTPGTVAPNDLDLALSKMNADNAQLEATKAAYAEVENTRDYLEIKAPFSGVISARNVNTGAYVGPSGKGSEYPMFTLQEQKKLRLVVAVPEAYTSYLHENDTITFNVNAFPNQTFKAHVKRLAGALDNRLRAQRIEMDVENANKKLLPGMVANVHISLSANDSTFIVPRSALVNSPERVFVIKIANNKAQWVDVKKGREADGRVEVYGNLNPRDQLVKTASEEIRDGTVVNETKEVQP